MHLMADTTEVISQAATGNQTAASWRHHINSTKELPECTADEPHLMDNRDHVIRNNRSDRTNNTGCSVCFKPSNSPSAVVTCPRGHLLCASCLKEMESDAYCRACEPQHQYPSKTSHQSAKMPRSQTIRSNEREITTYLGGDEAVNNGNQCDEVGRSSCCWKSVCIRDTAASPTNSCDHCLSNCACRCPSPHSEYCYSSVNQEIAMSQMCQNSSGSSDSVSECPSFDRVAGNDKGNSGTGYNDFLTVLQKTSSEIEGQTAEKRAALGAVENNLREIEKNKQSVMHRLGRYEEEVRVEFERCVQEETDAIKKELDASASGQIKELNTMKNHIQSSIMSDEGIQNWMETLKHQNCHAEVEVLNELQPDFMRRMRQIQLQSSLPLQQKQPTLYEFIPSDIPNVLSKPLVGMVAPLDNGNGEDVAKISPNHSRHHDSNRNHAKSKRNNKKATEIDQNYVPISSSYAGHSCEFDKVRIGSPIENKKFRVFKSSLRKVTDAFLEEVKRVHIGTWAGRICVFRNMLWIPCNEDKCIKVLSPDGVLQHEVSLHTVKAPSSVHPLGSNKLVIATKSGLYILDYKGHVKNVLSEQWFVDVHIEGSLICSLTFQKVYLWKLTDNIQLMANFAVDVSPNCNNTILLSHPHVYVADFCGNKVLKYDMKGEFLGQFGSTSSLSFPRLSMRDEQYNLLVANTCSDHLTVLSESGSEFDVLRVKAHRCRDVVITGDTMYVLTVDNKIVIYRVVQKIAVT